MQKWFEIRNVLVYILFPVRFLFYVMHASCFKMKHNLGFHVNNICCRFNLALIHKSPKHVVLGLLVSGFLTVILCQQILTRPLHSNPSLTTCLTAPIAPLRSFDPYILSQKSAGLSENDVETRFQENVWDTLLNSSFFPAWSDMPWSIRHYARHLHYDLRIFYISAHNALRAAAPNHHSTKLSLTINTLHRRLDRLRGLQYVANLTPQTGTNQTYNLLLSQALDAQCHVALSEVLSPRPVYILLPYSARPTQLRIFLQNFLLLRQLGDLAILLISAHTPRDARFAHALKRHIFNETSPLSNAVRILPPIKNVHRAFSRGVAIRQAAKQVPFDSDITFHCDVDMIIRPGFLSRCAQYTLLNSQVFFPIFYSLFPYATTSDAVVRAQNGFWRRSSFGMVCISAGDFFRVGAFADAESRFDGWGGEDVWQFERVRNESDLVAFRAVDPGLLHRWHDKMCDVSTTGFADCMKTNFLTMGHPLRIGPLLLDSLKDVPTFFKQLEQS